MTKAGLYLSVSIGGEKYNEMVLEVIDNYSCYVINNGINGLPATNNGRIIENNGRLSKNNSGI